MSAGRGGWFVGAAAIAIAVATSGGGIEVVVPVDQTSVTASRAKHAAREGDPGTAWQRLRVIVRRHESRQDLDCAAHSFGQVREFFVRTPCRSLDRELLLITDEHGGSGVVSIAWVHMTSGDAAERLKRLDDVQGTGDVSAVGGDLLSAFGVRFTGEHYASRAPGPLFVRAEAAATSGIAPELLDAVAEVAKWLPPPR